MLGKKLLLLLAKTTNGNDSFKLFKQNESLTRNWLKDLKSQHDGELHSLQHTA